MKIAWVSALTGQPSTKSTYFTKAMLSNVPSWADVTLLVGGGESHRNYLSVKQDDFDIFVFQLDDSPCNSFVYDAACRFSGYVHLHQYHLPFLTEQIRLHNEAGKEQELDEKTLDFIRRGWIKNQNNGGRQLIIPENQQVISSESFADSGNFLCRFPVIAQNKISETGRIAVRAQSSVEDRAVSALLALSEVDKEKIFICYSEEEREQLERRAKRHQVEIQTEVLSTNEELVSLFDKSDVFVGLRRDQTRGLPLEHYLAAASGCLVVTSEGGFSGDFYPKMYPHLPVNHFEEQTLAELFTHYDKLMELRIEAVNVFREEHSPQNAWADYEEIFSLGSEKQQELTGLWDQKLIRATDEILAEETTSWEMSN